MISDDLRRRIAALNKGRLQHGPEEAAAKLPADPLRSARARLRLSLEDVVEGVEVRCEAGRFLLIDRPLQALFPAGGEAFGRRYAQTISSLVQTVPHDLRGTLQPLADAGPEDVLYVDIETTGLSATTPLFLVGTLVFEAGELRVRQLLARDYSEEAALLAYFRRMLAHAEVVVSFNGKSYDFPYIRDRSLFFGLPFHLRQAHIDMLHEGRRRWKDRLPNCRLQTLERSICRRIRTGDIPGAEIPDAYHRFVRTGNAVEMRDILHHNALDLITMAELLVFILEGRDL